MALGKQIKKYRTALGWTLERLSDASGVDIGTISAIEVRDSARSKYSTALASALGLTVEQLEREELSYQLAADNVINPPIASEPSVIHLGRRGTDDHPAIAKVIALMQSMDDAGKWVLVGKAEEVAVQFTKNKQASSSQ